MSRKIRFLFTKYQLLLDHLWALFKSKMCSFRPFINSFQTVSSHFFIGVNRSRKRLKKFKRIEKSQKESKRAKRKDIFL